MSGIKITVSAEWEALHAFDAENNVEPARVIAERISQKFEIGWASRLVDEIAFAIEDARWLGEKRGPLIPKYSAPESPAGLEGGIAAAVARCLAFPLALHRSV